MSEVGVSGKAVGLYVVGSYRVSSMEYIFFGTNSPLCP